MNGDSVGSTSGTNGGVETTNGGGEALVTYRYLRVGIIAAVIMLLASLVYERTQAPGCWLGSISAYYYTPVRSIFVGGLLAIGVCLIIIRGRRLWEDFFLNMAGMFAPVVALVPTFGARDCFSIPADQRLESIAKDGDKEVFAEWVVAGIRNNMAALFIAGLCALAAAWLLRDTAPASVATQHASEAVLWAFGATALTVVVGLVLFVTWDRFQYNAHFAAAGSMFVCFGVVVLLNERQCDTRSYKRWYRAILLCMALAVPLLFIPDDQWEHKVLWVEFIEIGLFAFFWGLQTKEQWLKIKG